MLNFMNVCESSYNRQTHKYVKPYVFLFFLLFLLCFALLWFITTSWSTHNSTNTYLCCCVFLFIFQHHQRNKHSCTQIHMHEADVIHKAVVDDDVYETLMIWRIKSVLLLENNICVITTSHVLHAWLNEV